MNRFSPQKNLAKKKYKFCQEIKFNQENIKVLPRNKNFANKK
jgi:hypothetical protein